MRIRTVTREQLLKVAETKKKMGDKHWANAKNNPDKGYEFANARRCYETARRAKESADKMGGKK